EALVPGRDLGGNLALVARFVREHRLAYDVADREDVRHIRALLLIDFDEAALVDLDAGLLGCDLAPVRAAADRDEHATVGLRSARSLVALEVHSDTGRAGLDLHDTRAEHDGLVTRRDALLE